MWCEVAKSSDFVAGGMLGFEFEGRSICLCEYDGEFYAVSRWCGHQDVPLDQGALADWVLTCPLHHARFDIRDGAVVGPPYEFYLGRDSLPEGVKRFVELDRRLQTYVPTHPLVTYPVRVVEGVIEVEILDPSET